MSGQKTVNKLKARLERRHSPASHDQSTVPFADAIRDYWARAALSFAIPAHDGGRRVVPEAARWTGTEAFRSDLPLSHGLDTRDRAWQIQQTAQDLFAEAVGADATLFSTNGSSMSAHVAVLAVAGPGEKIVVARNGHKSAIAGLVMSGAVPVWVHPEHDAELELTHGIAPDALRATLDEHPDAKAAMIFTPTYYGVSADVAALAGICHERGIPLVTDDAWGLDYSFSEDLPPSALSSGADLAIGSVHKTLTGLGQTSVLSVQGDRIDMERLQRCFELEESTSTSALLLSSIDGARAQFVRDGRTLMDHAGAMADRLRAAIAGIDGIEAVAAERLLGGPGAVAVDPTHVIIELGGLGLTGYEADDWLRDEHAIDVELADHRRLMALVTFSHDEADVDRFAAALRQLAAEHGGRDGAAAAGMEAERISHPAELVTEQAMVPRDAFFAPSEQLEPGDAIGRVSADMVVPYPPGVPALAPGEVITTEINDYLQAFVKQGGFVEGATDPALETLRVVARP